ncbi:hypothetical protein ACO0QE_004790 [Hanseniaspora vineae]
MTEQLDVPFENPNKRVWKQKVFEGHNAIKNDDANDLMYENLQKTLNDFENERDFRPLMQFLSKHQQQLVQSWSLYAQINNHKKVTLSLNRLTAVLSKINQNAHDCPEQLYDICSEMVRSIVVNYTKTLYRAINNMRGSLTNPTLRLMTEIVTLQNGKHIDEFISHFDFSLPSLPKLLIPSKAELADVELTKTKNQHLTLRYNFIKFYAALISHSPAILRKDILIDNSKLMSNWFKYISKVDSDAVINEAIDLLTNCIVKEPSFKKSTKCKIVNEYILLNLHKLYYNGNAKIASKVNAFLILYSTDPVYGVAFENHKSWTADVDESSRQNNGAQITVHNKSFKLLNKILYTMLTQFKPWEDDTQCTTVIKILKHIPEFVSPYSHYLMAAHGSHEPKMTSYWFGQTLLLSKMIKLPIPQSVFELDFDSLPSMTVVLDNIMPLPITKAVLKKCLSNEVKLVQQMGCQLTVFILQKLANILELYTLQGWNKEKPALLNSVFGKLPELSDFTSLLNETYTNNSDNKLLILTITKILNLYSKQFPSTTSVALPPNNIYSDLMAKSQQSDQPLSGIDLAILDEYLEFQQLNENYKWWNKDKSGHSLFTALLRICSSGKTSVSMSAKISNLLNNLVSHTLLFNQSTLLVPSVYALVESLRAVFSTDKPVPAIWGLLDETVARCVRTPYKYIDISTEYGFCSPFMVALLEQFKFVSKDAENYDVLMRWICILARDLLILGDSTKLRELLAQNTGIDKNLTATYLNILDEQNFATLNSDESYLLVQNKASSFYRFITVTPMKSLSNISKIPVGMEDVQGAFFRLSTAVNNEETALTQSNCKVVIQNLLEKIGHFMFTSAGLASKFENIAHYSPYFIKETDTKLVQEKKLYVLMCILDVLLQVKIRVEGLDDYLASLFQHYEQVKGDFPDISIFEAIIEYLPIKFADQLSTIALKEVDQIAILRKMLSSKDYAANFDYLTKTALFYTSSEVVSLVASLLKNCPVKNVIEGLRLFAPLNTKPILESLALSDREAALEFLSAEIFLENHVMTEALIFVGSFITDIPQEIGEVLTKAAFSLFQENPQGVKKVLPFLTQNVAYMSDEQKNAVLSYLFTKLPTKYCSEVAKFARFARDFERQEFLVWFQKCMLFINKQVAEIESLETMSDNFAAFLAEVGSLFEDVNVWNIANATVLNSQLEIFFQKKWVFSDFIVSYLSKLLLIKSDRIAASKLFQILINNEHNPLRTKRRTEPIAEKIAMLLFILFHKDPTGNSNLGTQEAIVACYGGSLAPHDCILYEILQAMESVTSTSWANSIYAWDFLDNLNAEESQMLGDTKLIAKEKEGFVVTLNKNVIDFTIENFVVSIPAVPAANAAIADWNEFTKAFSLLDAQTLNSVYDTRFIMLLLLNNTELVQRITNDEDGSVYTRFDMKKILKTQLFSLILVSMCSKNEASTISLNIMKQMAQCSNSEESMDTVVKVLLKKISFTFIENKDRKPSDFCCPLYWFALTRLCNALLDPRSFMFEKAFRWVFASPNLRYNDIPLFKQLVDFCVHTNDAEDYYKYVTWFLNVLECGISSVEDIDFMRKNKIFEWVMNLQTSAYVNDRVYAKVDQVISKIQSVYTKAGVLVSGFAGLSQLEMLNYINAYNFQSVSQRHKNNTNNLRVYKELLNLKQKRVNEKETALRYGALTSSSKRLREWCNEQDEACIKRICL